MSAERVAVVTGAGSGIGRAAALALLDAGFSVVLAGRRIEALQRTAGKAGGAARILVVPTDVTVEASVDTLFAAIDRQFGRLDVLFNNAGKDAPGLPVEDLNLAQWNEIIAVNLTGAFLCARAAFRLMKLQDPRGGRIINNGSVASQVPRPLAAPYAASKHAITGLTKSLALEGRAYDIACGQIDIGNAATDMTAAMTKGVMQADGSMKIEPRFDMRHVADAVVYMAKLPLDANVLSLTVMATAMPFVGRG
jgi:NAD(P)-dependent dehydrogenase (short-subunit alcohol dehydrogenase family)